MASSSSHSSSSTSNPSTKYDVFLSFRGVETRHKIRAHLKDALCEKGIKTFTDDQNMEVGEYVSPQLIQAIENSRCSVIIISAQYASSKWCLIELVKILDCMKKMGQIVIPIFYHVERCNVQNQTGDFGKAFERRQRDSEVENWRDALSEVAKLPGFELQDRDEAEFVKEIVEEVSSKLTAVASPTISDDFSVLSSRVGVARLLASLSSWLTGVDYFRFALFFLHPQQGC